MRHLFILSAILPVLLFSGCNHDGEDVDYSLIPVKSGDRFGYVNPEDGKFVINPQFDNATLFRDGIARVYKDRQYGYIDKEGRYICLPQFQAATLFAEGLAWTVENGGYPKAIDTQGKVQIEAKNVYGVMNFSEGLAAYSEFDDEGNALCGFMNHDGETVIPPNALFRDNFHNGLARIENENHRWGYADKNGETAIECQFEVAHNFSPQGYAAVRLDGKWGIINKKGEFTAAPQFDLLFNDGELFCASMKAGGDLGFFDAHGNIIANPQFQAASSFGQSDYAAVKMGERIAYVDKEGKIAIAPQFSMGTPFLGDYALAATGESWGIIDKEGNYVVNPQFDGIPTDYLVRGAFSPNAADCQVLTQYLDADKVETKIRQLLADGKFDGMSFPPSVEAIMTRYGQKDVPVYTAWEPAELFIACHVKARLVFNGYFYNEVSDGWWGTKSVLDPKAQAESVKLRLELGQGADGHAHDLESELQKRFKGECGDFRLGIQVKDKDQLILTISK